MPRYVALLRAINVTGRNIKMERLREIFQELDVTQVETFIASGNVIFEAASTDPVALAQQIEEHLERSLGYPVATFLRTPAQLAQVVAAIPFSPSDLSDEAASVYIAFAATTPTSAAQEKLLACGNAVDTFHVRQHDIYWLCQRRFSDSTFSSARMEKMLQIPLTVRNSSTIKKLAAKYAPS